MPNTHKRALGGMLLLKGLYSETLDRAFDVCLKVEIKVHANLLPGSLHIPQTTVTMLYPHLPSPFYAYLLCLTCTPDFHNIPCLLNYDRCVAITLFLGSTVRCASRRDTRNHVCYYFSSGRLNSGLHPVIYPDSFPQKFSNTISTFITGALSLKVV